jgi:hypothetical protein
MTEIGYALPVDGVINLLCAKRRLACSEGLLKIRKFKSYNTLHYFSLYHAPYL